MNVKHVKGSELQNWLELVREVEPLFGPMVGEPGFHKAIKEVINEERAYGAYDDSGKLSGVIVISFEKNEIEWFAVMAEGRQKGYGKALINYAINKLDSAKPITVQTFDETVWEGLGARKLYLAMGFHEVQAAGLNPAGLPTVILRREILDK